MRNHARFQESLNLDMVIHIIQVYIKLSVNSSKKSMNNDITNFTILKFFNI